MADFDPTFDVILQTVAGVKEWVASFSAEFRSLFLPTGLLDWRTAPDDSPFVDPATPKPGRVRSFVVNRVLQFMDENGFQGSFGELISTDANGIRRVIPPGDPGSILVTDPAAPTRVSWGNVLGVSQIKGQHQAGTVFDYGALSSVIASEIQYTRIFLAKDLVIKSVHVFRGLGGSAARFINLGIYDQADPSSLTGSPATRLAETGAEDTAGTGTDEFLAFSFTSGDLTIPATGFYWVAFISDTASPVTFSATPGTFPANFLPVLREVSAGATLPATASGLTNPASAVSFAAVLE